MVCGINTFHHLGIVTRDLSKAGDAYERLGFLLTPLSFPQFPLTPGGAPEVVGVGNRHAIFKNSYLELLGVVDPVRWDSISTAQRGPFDIDRPLNRYEGLHVMHFGTENLEEVRARLVSEGVNPSTIEPFQRTVEIPGGSAVMRARRLSFAPGDNPEALFQIVEHDTPELVLQPRYMAHPNGAQTLTEVILCVDDPKKAATRYASYAGHRAARLGDLFVIDLGEARLLIVDPSGLTSVLPGQDPAGVALFRRIYGHERFAADGGVSAAAGDSVGQSW